MVVMDGSAETVCNVGSVVAEGRSAGWIGGNGLLPSHPPGGGCLHPTVRPKQAQQVVLGALLEYRATVWRHRIRHAGKMHHRRPMEAPELVRALL
jgi:hypothetical protein